MQGDRTGWAVNNGLSFIDGGRNCGRDPQKDTTAHLSAGRAGKVSCYVSGVNEHRPGTRSHTVRTDQAASDAASVFCTYYNSPYHLRYNRLLGVLFQTLRDLLKAMKGQVVMSSQLELMANSLYNNSVPELWRAKVSILLKSSASRVNTRQ